MLQLAWLFSFPACFTRVPPLATCQPQDLVTRPYWVHTFELLFTLSHTLPLYESHLNTRFLNTELQANWHGIKKPYWVHTFELFFTLFHTVSLHESPLNTGFLNAELQANWHGIKLTKWLIKFNLTPTFKHLNDCSLLHSYSCSDSHLMNHSFKISHLVRRIINHCSVPPI